nr:ribonuclease H-like domain-containing protein [Tanacetum cinerariifolium]
MMMGEKPSGSNTSSSSNSDDIAEEQSFDDDQGSVQIGEIDGYKARLVAKGYNKRERIDYEETFSLVVKMGTVICLISLDVQSYWKLFKLDVNNAFLYGSLDEDVCMLPPPGFLTKIKQAFAN